MYDYRKFKLGAQLHKRAGSVHEMRSCAVSSSLLNGHIWWSAGSTSCTSTFKGKQYDTVVPLAALGVSWVGPTLRLMMQSRFCLHNKVYFQWPQADRQTDRQTSRQISRQTGRQADRQIIKSGRPYFLIQWRCFRISEKFHLCWPKWNNIRDSVSALRPSGITCSL